MKTSKMNTLLSSLCGCLLFTVSSCTRESKATVEAYVTTNNRSKDFAKEMVKTQKAASDTCIVLNPSTRYQVMDGFGAAMTGSTCYNLLQMSAEDRHRFLEETFSVEKGMGYSYVRISIGCSDFSLSEYTCCDEP